MTDDQKHLLQYVMNASAGGLGMARAVKQAAEMFDKPEEAVWDVIRAATGQKAPR